VAGAGAVAGAAVVAGAVGNYFIKNGLKCCLFKISVIFTPLNYII
jgi:hypothetical protein